MDERDQQRKIRHRLAVLRHAELHVYPGAPHGVGLFPQTKIAQRYAADREAWHRRQLEGMG